jgi:hypothetical protein
MPIYVNKNGQQSGPYEEHVVIDQLSNGSLSPNDLAIRHGDPGWKPLGELFPGFGAAPAVSADRPVYAEPATPARAVVDSQPEAQYRTTILQKIFFGLCFVGVVIVLASCVYYLFTFTSTGSLDADLSRLGYRDLVRNLAIGSFVCAFFALLALILSFKRKLIRSNGARIALRIFFVLVLFVGIGNVLAGAVTYFTHSAPAPTKASESNELLRALEAGSAMTAPFEIAMFTLPIGAGLFLFGVSGILMAKRPRD